MASDEWREKKAEEEEKKEEEKKQEESKDKALGGILMSQSWQKPRH